MEYRSGAECRAPGIGDAQARVLVSVRGPLEGDHKCLWCPNHERLIQGHFASQWDRSTCVLVAKIIVAAIAAGILV